jgi:hypothetical protein
VAFLDNWTSPLFFSLLSSALTLSDLIVSTAIAGPAVPEYCAMNGFTDNSLDEGDFGPSKGGLASFDAFRKLGISCRVRFPVDQLLAGDWYVPIATFSSFSVFHFFEHAQHGPRNTLELPS